MAYCTSDDIKKIINEDVLTQLTDDENLGVIGAEKVDEAIANADSMVDGYAASRYLTPFSPVPRLIHIISIDIAIYNLYSRRENVPEIREKRYKDAVKLLDRLADGKLTIGEVDQPVVESSGVIKTTTRPKLFGRETLENY